ncbi:MAG: FHA domain-containing protein [Ruminococcaceae bacterium]|nr:FHA domain-containing protein [Oscillospiraceae bacterium]
MNQLIADILRYTFVIVIYIFIFNVIKLIYLDISDTTKLASFVGNYSCYLKLINLQSDFEFKVHESYGISDINIIGRSRKCDVFIPDPLLSKQHARIFKHEGNYYVQDLLSTNGTFLNGKKLGKKAVKIKDSDKITFGTICFLLVDLNSAE